MFRFNSMHSLIIHKNCHVEIFMLLSACIVSDAKPQKTFFFYKKSCFLKPSSKKTFFYFDFLQFKENKDISILWSAYSVIHIIYCIVQAAKQYMNCIYIDSDSINFMIFISKI